MFEIRDSLGVLISKTEVAADALERLERLPDAHHIVHVYEVRRLMAVRGEADAKTKQEENHPPF